MSKLKDVSDYKDEILEIFHTRFSDLPSKYLSDDVAHYLQVQKY